MANRVKKKFDENHPTYKAILRYEQEIAVLEEKRDKANEACDWTMRNFYANQITAKRTNMEILKAKFGKHNIATPLLADEDF